MVSKFYLPHPSLLPFIEGFIHIDTQTNKTFIDQPIDYFPIGSSFLAFILREPTYLLNSGKNHSYIRFNFTGQMDQYHFLKSSDMSMICVRFKPFGAYRLLGIPQNICKNQVFDVCDIFGLDARVIKNKLEDHIDDPEKVISIIQNWLLYLLEKNRKCNTIKIEFICDQIIKEQGTLNIKELNKICLMSKSSMEQHFKEKVGLSPKVFSRIIRFQQIYSYLKTQTYQDWMKLVTIFGYYDQSHFIHEFKHLYGYAPTQLKKSIINISEKLKVVD